MKTSSSVVGFIQNIKIWIDHNCRQESPDFKAHFRELGFIFIYMDVYIVDSELYSVFRVICVYIYVYMYAWYSILNAF